MQMICSHYSMLLALTLELKLKASKKMATRVELHHIAFIPLLVDKTLDINFHVYGMNAVTSKCEQNNKPLDEHF